MGSKVNLDKATIESLVNSVLEEKGYTGGFVDVVKIAQEEGFEISTNNFRDNTDGIILVNIHDDVTEKKLIAINANRSYADKRFILAHELSHYFIEKNLNSASKSHILIAQRDGEHGHRSDVEQMVDLFAACLLVPSADFKRRIEEMTSYGYSMSSIIKTLSRIYGVTEKCIERRVLESVISEG